MPIEDIIKAGESDTVEFKTTFKEVGFIERYGSGILRVRQICSDYGVREPKFEEVFNGFQVTLFKEKVSSGELNDGLNDGLNERQKKVLKEIKNTPGIKGKELSEHLNIPIDTIDRYIKLFTSRYLIERRGSKKTGGYHLTGEQ